jgi:hypothetical protein
LGEQSLGKRHVSDIVQPGVNGNVFEMLAINKDAVETSKARVLNGEVEDLEIWIV